MKKEWSKIIRASGLGIPESEAGRIGPPLEALELAFRPLTKTLGPGDGTAFVFRAEEEDNA